MSTHVWSFKLDGNAIAWQLLMAIVVVDTLCVRPEHEKVRHAGSSYTATLFMYYPRLSFSMRSMDRDLMSTMGILVIRVPLIPMGCTTVLYCMKYCMKAAVRYHTPTEAEVLYCTCSKRLKRPFNQRQALSLKHPTKRAWILCWTHPWCGVVSQVHFRRGRRSSSTLHCSTVR